MTANEFSIKYKAEYITSRSNKTAVMLAKLSDRKYREEYGLYMCEGTKLSYEAALHSKVEYLIISESALNNTSVMSMVKEIIEMLNGTKIYLFADTVFEKLSTEKSPQGVVAAARMPEKNTEKIEAWQEGRRIIILDSVRDPGNLGTIIRTAATMGFGSIVTIDCADLYNPKTLRASMGAVFRVSVYDSENGAEDIKTLRRENRRVLGAALGTNNLILGQYQPIKTDCIVIGNEGHGISDEVLNACDSAVIIPMSEGSESLNASAAASVIMWEYSRTFGMDYSSL